jgi:hypothetical protein
MPLGCVRHPVRFGFIVPDFTKANLSEVHSDSGVQVELQ